MDDLAPNHDGISNPCAQNSNLAPPAIAGSDEGYVFARTDKDELRWIAVNASGGMGSVWIDAACAARLGGSSASGRWSELLAQAPALDTIAYPCQ